MIVSETYTIHKSEIGHSRAAKLLLLMILLLLLRILLLQLHKLLLKLLELRQGDLDSLGLLLGGFLWDLLRRGLLRGLLRILL